MRFYYLFVVFFTLLTSAFSQAGDNKPKMTREIYEINLAKPVNNREPYNPNDSLQMLIGTPATSFKFKTLKGDSISLSELKGKVVFLNVFQSLCGPCLKEIPFLANLSETYRGLDVVFLAVSIRDSKENLHWVNKRYAPQAEDSPLIFVPASYFGNREDSFTSMENKETGYLNETFYLFRDNYYVRINPISYLIDQDGIIREIFRGYNAKYDHTDFYSEAINILLRK